VRALARWWWSDARTGSDRDHAFNLAIFRLVFLWFVALPMARGSLRWAVSTLPTIPADAWQPISFYRLLPHELLADATLATWLAAANVALVALGLLGVWTRAALAVATLLSLYLFGLAQCFGKVDHVHHVIWFMALLAAGPAGHCLSVGSLLVALRAGRGGPLERPIPPGAPLATLRCIWILFGLIFAATGAAKLHAALTAGWAEPEQVRHLVRSVWLIHQLDDPRAGPAISVEGMPDWLLSAGAVGVIAFQLSFLPLVLVRPVRPLLAIAGILFHRVNAAVLNIAFAFLVPAYAVLVDWVASLRWLGKRLGLAPVAVRYDPRCPSCRRRIALLRALDALDLVTPVEDPGLVDHRVAGALRAVPLLWPLAPLLARLRSPHRRHEVIPAAVSPAARGRAVRVVGAMLIVGQGATSALAGLDPPPWPFDRYPTFTRLAREREVRLLEARAILAGGEEVVLGDWRRACVRAVACFTERKAIVAEADPARRRERAARLAARLLAVAPPAVREAAREIAIDALTVRLEARPVIVRREPLDRIPAR
jgi:hypothetical protein